MINLSDLSRKTDNPAPGANGRSQGLPPIEIIRSRPGLSRILKVEVTMYDVNRFMRGRHFKSIEEGNAILREITAAGSVPRTEPATPLEQAQDIIYRTCDEPRRQRVKAAKEALAISPDCADAYVILAEAAKTPEEARRLYEDGVAAGERALGPKVFKKQVGHFWGPIETRPYMRARLGLARCLEEMGEKEAAIGHYRDLLRLNPKDHQGVRYLLINTLLELGRDGEAEQLIRQFPDDVAADWFYSRALLAWLREGDTPATRDILSEAIDSNIFVPDYILGREKLPRILPDRVSFGEEDEAIVYAVLAKGAWHRDSEALEWLETVADEIEEQDWLDIEDALDIDDDLDDDPDMEDDEDLFGEPSDDIIARSQASLASDCRRIWEKVKSGKPLRGKDADLAKILLDHREFSTIWERVPYIKTWPFLVEGVNPFFHIVSHAIFESQVSSPELREVAEALQSFIRAGAGRHEASHALMAVLSMEVHDSLTGAGEFNKARYLRRLKFFAEVAAGLADGTADRLRPGRNDPCPCGSGRKFKRCCGEDGEWPPFPMIPGTENVPEDLLMGPARGPRPGGLMLLDTYRYAEPKVLTALSQDHPLVYLENTFYVAHALERAGDPEGAYLTFKEMLAYAEKIGRADLAREVLEDLLAFCVDVPGHEEEGISIAHRLIDMTEPDLCAIYRGDIAKLLFRMGKGLEAESIYRELMAEHPNAPWLMLSWAGFLGEQGRFAEAEVALNAVITLCEGKEDEFSEGYRTLAREQLEVLAEERDGKVKGKRGRTKIKPGLQ